MANFFKNCAFTLYLIIYLFQYIYIIWTGAGKHFWGRVPKLSINCEEILSRAHGNAEELNEVLDSPIVIIIYCIIIINAYYNNISCLV
jgi:hypothetical protein